MPGGATDETWYLDGLEGRRRPPRERPGGRKMFHVAYAITITVWKSSIWSSSALSDGAAVLAHSIATTQNSESYTLDLIAILGQNATAGRGPLTAMGYRVLIGTTPVLQHEITPGYYRDSYESAGCCGSSELLKLRAYQLIEYDRVLVLDTDAVLLQSIEHLFTRSMRANLSLVYTNDHSLDNPGSAAPPVQGGFLLVAPSRRVYTDMLAIIRKGDFRPGTGWGGQKIGWCWGGRTVQGLLPYYYHRVAPPNASLAIDNCRYNGMANEPRNCSSVAFSSVYTAHFTLCQKPWVCRQHTLRLCRRMHHAWWAARASLLAAHDREEVPAARECERGAGSYPPLPNFFSAWPRPKRWAEQQATARRGRGAPAAVLPRGRAGAGAAGPTDGSSRGHGAYAARRVR